MKSKYKFEILELDDDVVAVPTETNAAGLHGVLKLNKEGAEILRLLADETDENTIVRILSEKYDNDLDSLSEYVHSFVSKLKSYELLLD